MAEHSNLTENEEEDEEEAYLCKLFGEDGRFVEFVNLTGRPVRLTSRLQMDNFSNMAWSTTIIIPEGGRHVWRFLGDSPNHSPYISMLPDPYNLARRNSYRWKVEYIDTQEEETITFDNMDGPLRLETMQELLPGETSQVMLRRKTSAVAPLHKLAKDAVVKVSPEDICWLDIPRTLQEQLSALSRDYQEMERSRVEPCGRCKEIHQ
eukprot:GFUD01021024.1.p1 GENE.GFUD01021024.1~~GFUD01021024.1.p1  ORF type:complete len:207 (+),score=83.92 GFUD01021024.1:125-745(+)